MNARNGIDVGLRRFKPYPDYKDSGVEWLDRIPIDWDNARLRFRTSLNPSKIEARGLDGAADVSFVAMEAIGEYGGINLETSKPLISVSEGYTYFRDGDVVVAKITPCFENGKGALADGLTSGIAFGTTELHVIRASPHVNSRFLFYLTLSDHFRRLGAAEMYGAGGQKRVPEDFVRNLRHPMPNGREQRAIASFLDRETAKIDALVAKNELLINLLQENRAALIDRAVTKGLDPNLPMKYSGFDWLGDIPVNWGVTFVKRKARCIQTGATPPTGETRYYAEGTVPWYGPGSFTDDLPLQTAARFINESAVRDGVARTFDAGSTMIVTIGATIGKVAQLECMGSCNQQITGITLRSDQVSAKYAAYQLKRLEPVLRGIAPSTTLPILDQDQIGYLPLIIPPRADQEHIISFLDRETAKIDVLDIKICDAIARLAELRSALIAAAVTGKIDVREEVA